MRQYFFCTTVLTLLLVAASAMAKVVVVDNDDDLNKLIETNQPILLEFASDWCGVCQSIAHPFEKVSDEPEFKDVLFVHVNADKARHATKTYGIVGVPTFIYMKNGVKKDQIIGVENLQKFEEDLGNHIRSTLLTPVDQNIDTVMPKEKAMTLDEIASGVPQASAAPTAQDKSAEAPKEEMVGIMGHIKGFFIMLLAKLKDLLLWIKDGLMWLIDKIAFWRK